MSELPQGWANVALGLLGQWGSGGTPSRGNQNYYVNGTIPWLVIGDLNDGYVSSAATKITREGLSNSSAKLLPENTLLVAMYGSIGKLGITRFECATNQAIAFCKPNSELVNLKFLFYSVMNQKKALIEQGQGGAQQNISQGILKLHEIPLAPLSEQKRIADKLDALLARVDATRARLDRIPTLLKRFRQSILAAATSGQLTENWRAEHLTKPSVQPVAPVHHGIDTDHTPPKGQVETSAVAWADAGSPTSPEFTPRSASQAQPNHPWHEFFMRDVLESLKYGTSKKCDYEPVGRPVLRIPNIGNGFICRDDLKYATFDEKEEKSLALEKGDLLLIRSNGSLDLVGKVAMVSERETGFLYAGYLIRLRVAKDLVLPEFASLWLSSPRVRDYIKLTARSTSGVNNLNSEEIGDIRIAVPLREEQEEIVRRVDALFALANKVEAKYTTARAQVDKLTPALLAKAFRGELVRQDPNDEPAANLRERVRTTRKPMPVEGKKGRKHRKTREAV